MEKTRNSGVQREVTPETTTTQTIGKLTEHLATKQQTEVKTLKNNVSSGLSNLRNSTIKSLFGTVIGGGLWMASGLSIISSMSASAPADPIAIYVAAAGTFVTIASLIYLNSAFKKVEKLVEMRPES
jgi:hypothetical protein